MSLRLLLTLCGGLEICAGLLALISPATVVSLLLGSPLDSIGALLARLFGAGVFALGLACLKSRNDAGSPAGLAVSLGITSYNVLAAVVLLWAAARSGLGGLLLWGAGILHAALGALFVSALVTSRR
jgi:xanthine/uracil permease